MVQQAYNSDKERIRQIVISRLSFMVQCAVEPELKKEFYADPIPFMRRQGQKIPENAKKIAVDVDAESIRWPVITIFFPRPVEIDGKKVWAVQYDEALDIKRFCDQQENYQFDLDCFEFEVLETIPEAMQEIVGAGGEEIRHKLKAKRDPSVERLIPFPIEECGVYIKMPFVDVDVEILEEVKFDDGEIVLTSCT